MSRYIHRRQRFLVRLGVVPIFVRNNLRSWLFAIVLILAIGCANKGPDAGTVVKGNVDDHGNSIAAATAVTVPFNTTARLEIAGDIDIFAIPLLAGRSYGFETNLGTLLDTNLKLLDQWNQEYAASDDFAGLGSRIEYTPANSLTMYIQVTGNGRNTGSYEFSVETFTLLPVRIERIVHVPVTGDGVDILNPGVAIFKAQLGSEIVLVGTGFSPNVKENNIWLGNQLLAVTSVGPGFVTVIVDGVVEPDPVRLTIGTDFGEDSIEFTVEPPSPPGE